MAYHIHHTEGIVLQTKSVHDANVILFIYTKDMGLIIARATSLRLYKSRLRFVLQRFSRVSVDLVHGKHGFILTSAKQINNNSDIFRHPNRKTSFAVLTGVIMRLIQGEDPNPALFNDIIDLLEILRKLESKEACYSFDLLASILILNNLGYWDKKEEDSLYLGEIKDVKEVLLSIFKNRKTLIPRINESFRNTSL